MEAKAAKQWACYLVQKRDVLKKAEMSYMCK